MPPPARNVLLCPLDWGLGHATRSLALAARLRAAGTTVHWASSGPAAALLRRELPATEVHELPAYGVRYPTASMVWNVLRQAPGWWRTLRTERRVVGRLAERLGVDAIVSDSRFGAYHPGIRSIFLTHQLHPITHFRPASYLYRHQLGRFGEFWVPDHAGPDRLSGRLSDPAGYENVHYVGPLSRLDRLPAAGPALDYLLLLSGPEPARTRLEDLLLAELAGYTGPVALVRGLPATSPAPARRAARSFGDKHTATPAGLTVYDYADRELLSRLMARAVVVVCRSGYSSLMDLRALGKRAILIPTPGQTEQIYLAERAAAAGWATHRPQGSGTFLRGGTPTG